MDLELINWLKDGKYRIRILRALSRRSMLPSELADSLAINRSSVSRLLAGLRKRGLINAVTSGSRTVTYELTERGMEVAKILERFLDVTK